MPGMCLFWEKNKRHTKLYVFWKKTKDVQDWKSWLKKQSSWQECIYFGYKTKDTQSFIYGRMFIFQYKNVYILDIKQKTYKVLYLQECTYFGKRTKDKQSCLNSKNPYPLKKNSWQVGIFYVEKKT